MEEMTMYGECYIMLTRLWIFGGLECGSMVQAMISHSYVHIAHC